MQPKNRATVISEIEKFCWVDKMLVSSIGDAFRNSSDYESIMFEVFSDVNDVLDPDKVKLVAAHSIYSLIKGGDPFISNQDMELKFYVVEKKMREKYGDYGISIDDV